MPLRRLKNARWDSDLTTNQSMSPQMDAFMLLLGLLLILVNQDPMPFVGSAQSFFLGLRFNLIPKSTLYAWNSERYTSH